MKFFLLFLLGIFAALFFFVFLSNTTKTHKRNKRGDSEVLPPFYHDTSSTNDHNDHSDFSGGGGGDGGGGGGD
ncbi:hypothetical protein HNQ85_003256 [Anoxybacillus calidus]|jgi:hypothetical protein|uniref:Uncharacterized protein n=1 Tax=[Anoxybacillus] calidus TaxID=575178 RepID=A0A7V9Z2Q6_9BACL|nr:hypothetical protein [Anoxybacillus calidus]MBA2872941.1 hypothetical protein [Anoxybacillus calidus]